MIRRAVPLAPLALLAACAIPHPKDGLTERARAEANGHRYVVNWNATTAQATRVNFAWQPDFAEVAAGAIEATERVSGCRVRPGSIGGEVALVEMRLDCDA